MKKNRTGEEVLSQLPAVERLEAELKREKYRQKYRNVLRSTVYTLLVVAAAAVLIATLWLPVLQIYGESMTPTLFDGDVVISWKSSDFSTGDVVAFYYNNRILVKRVIVRAIGWTSIRMELCMSTSRRSLSPMLWKKPLDSATSNCPIRSRRRRSSSWGTTAACRWIPAAAPSAAWPMRTSWGGWYFVYGL